MILTEILEELVFVKLEASDDFENEIIRQIITHAQEQIEGLMMSEREIYQIIIQSKNRDLTSMDEFLEEKKLAKAIHQTQREKLENT